MPQGPTTEMIAHLRTLGVGIHAMVETVPLPYQIYLLRAELEVKQAELHALEEQALENKA